MLATVTSRRPRPPVTPEALALIMASARAKCSAAPSTIQGSSRI
jgi:hypothetical protein